MTTETKGHEVTLKIRAFPYYVDGDDPVTGRPIRQELIARRGDTVTLNDVDYERAVRFDAIVTDADKGPSPGQDISPADQLETGQLSFHDATEADVAAWISQEKPSVDRVVEEANNDPALAQKLLDAENLATGQQPRSTLEKELKGIIG